MQVLYLYKRGELLMNQRKSLKELNLLDKFLFDEAMDDPENVKTMLDIILSQNTNLKHPPQTEKEQRTSIDNRQIRLDVYAIDEDDVIYEVEAQKENTHNLPKRSRLYQGIIDSKLLPPGVVDFNLLNEVLIVLIMPFDLFGYGLYRYTFQMKCEEVPELKLDDGATRIFLNTRGKHPELVSPELIELLKYMEHSTDEISEACESKRIQEMHRRVCQIKEGEFVGIMGKSGCGKTTLLKTLGMIDKPTDGTIKFMGEDTSELYGDKLADIRNSKIGFIFQDFYLMDSLSVEENIMLPMIISKQNINKMIAEAKKYAEQFQIEYLLKKNPYELSGGEKQRVAICRALINNPDLILADEPTGNLDSKSGKIVIDALNKISSEYKKTIVMVTHDPQMASYCDRIILLKDGKILEELKKGSNRETFYQTILSKMAEL